MTAEERAILWLHGWGMAKSAWEHDGEILERFPDWEHHYIDYSTCRTVEDYRALVPETLKRCGNRRWTLIGWSLGAMLALETAIGCGPKEGFQVEAIAAVGGTLKFVDRDRTRGWPSRIVTRMREKLETEREEVLAQFRGAMFSRRELEAGAEKLSGRWTDTGFSPTGLDAGLEYLLTADLSARWSRWYASSDRPKLLWLHGTDDPICPPGAIPSLKPGERIWLENAGHAPFLTQRKLFYDQLGRFLYEHR